MDTVPYLFQTFQLEKERIQQWLQGVTAAGSLRMLKLATEREG